MLLNILKSIGQSPTKNKYLFQDIDSAKIEKVWLTGSNSSDEIWWGQFDLFTWPIHLCTDSLFTQLWPRVSFFLLQCPICDYAYSVRFLFQILYFSILEHPFILPFIVSFFLTVELLHLFTHYVWYFIYQFYNNCFKVFAC